MNKTEFQNIIKSVREQLATDGIATISTGNCNYPKPIMTKKQEEQKRAMITADFEKENKAVITAVLDNDLFKQFVTDNNLTIAIDYKKCSWSDNKMKYIKINW